MEKGEETEKNERRAAEPPACPHTRPRLSLAQQHPPADCSPPTAAPPPTLRAAFAGPAATGA